jgi:hypothetical protein
MLEQYRAVLWSSWNRYPHPRMRNIPIAKSELIRRVAPSSDPFDGGRTAAWLAAGGDRLTWRSVRDAHTGHMIHCVSDRTATELTDELYYGLRLIGWMTQGAPVVWYWWDQPWQRVVPGGVDPGRDHVNGGWAVPGVREVHVYRREEAHKVLLHECVHALELDVPHSAVEHVRRQFEAALGRLLWPHFGEAYTELFAEWLWAIANSGTLTAAQRMWDRQVACASRQAAEVWARVRDSREAEDTNVFAYYIMKWVLLRDPEHLAVALLSPTHAVGLWWGWWLESRAELEMDANHSAATGSEERALRMGMTCLD